MTTEVVTAESESAPAERETELLAFYDRVRGRVSAYLGAKAGRLGAGTAAALLLVPDVLLMLVRLFLDRDTPTATRAVIGGALAYFLLPADLAPEIVIGPVGFLDDLVIACAVLGQVLGPDLERSAARYWSGSEKSLRVLGDVSRTGYQLLGVRLSKRVERLIESHLLKRPS